MSFPHASPHRICWNANLLDVREGCPKIPAGLLGACASMQVGARTRPLVVANRYDHAAIMAAAAKAARRAAAR
jgi:hypothetical protein